jgi:excisionase family DNA binding protein
VEEFFSLRDIADRLKVSEQTVRRWVKSGQLKAYKPGLEYRILASDLEEFLESRTPKGQASPSPPEVSDEERRHRELVERVADFLGRRPPDLEERAEEYWDAMTQALERVEQNRRFVEDPDQKLRQAEQGLGGAEPSAEDAQKAQGA